MTTARGMTPEELKEARLGASVALSGHELSEIQRWVARQLTNPAPRGIARRYWIVAVYIRCIERRLDDIWTALHDIERVTTPEPRR